MLRRFPYLVAIRGDRDRQLIVAGVVLALICVVLYVNLTIMLSKQSSRQKQVPIENTTANATRSTPSLQATTARHQLEQYRNATLPRSPAYKTSFGRVLGGYLYLNYQQSCQMDGHVSHVYLRLFTFWNGTAPLYLFVITFHDPVVSIVRQYGVTLHGNATGWQTITIPRGALPISHRYFLAVGMQDRHSTNQIYIVENFVSFTGRIGKDDTSSVSPEANLHDGVALAYTVAYNATATTTKPKPGR